MKKLILIVALFLCNMGMKIVFAGPIEKPIQEKRALAIIGDAWHCAAPIYNTIVRKIDAKGYKTDVIMDNNVPFDHFSDYKFIVISRYGYDNFKQMREGFFQKPEGNKMRWISPEQENALEEYVLNGGIVFFHHDGHSYYYPGGGVIRLAKTNHNGHPPMIKITVKPTGLLPELTEGVTPFEVSDEEFRMNLDETKTQVFMESYSKENGRTAQGWAHDYGKGKVIVFVPGHDRYSLENPMMDKCLTNIVNWLDK